MSKDKVKVMKHTKVNQLEEFRKLSPDQLIKKRNETMMLLLGSTSKIKPLTDPSNYSNI